jgi:hypothetical protein
VDRIAIPSIVSSGITVWGEDLLARVALLPIRRLDVAKAFFGLFNQVLFTAMVYPLLPGATKYAMDGLKRPVHSCHFCYKLRPAPLAKRLRSSSNATDPAPRLHVYSRCEPSPPSSGLSSGACPLLLGCTSGLRVTNGSPATLVLIGSDVVRPERQD